MKWICILALAGVLFGQEPVETGPEHPNVTPPQVIKKVDPEYSQEARSAHFQGSVLLQVVVGVDGRVSDIKVLRPLGLGLDEKAIKAVKKWRFKPGEIEGKPVRVRSKIEVSFRLL